MFAKAVNILCDCKTSALYVAIFGKPSLWLATLVFLPTNLNQLPSPIKEKALA